MCLIHDIVEIDAGDTYAYDAEGLKTKKEAGRCSQGADLFSFTGGSKGRTDRAL